MPSLNLQCEDCDHVWTARGSFGRCPKCKSGNLASGPETLPTCKACGSQSMRTRKVADKTFVRCMDCLTAAPLALDVEKVTMDYERMKWSLHV